MSHPRISVFASLANGDAAPVRVISGQTTLQGRTNHAIAIDSVHDEIVVPNPFAQAILFFRGGAKGEEPPIRVIQGPKTELGYTDNVAVDPVHKEVFAAEFRTNAILVFRSDVGGDVAPIRVIHGPKTKLDRPMKIAVDPVNNLLVVTSIPGLWFFNRTDNGDVAPRSIIAGPKSGIGGDNQILSQPILYPEGKKIIVSGGTRASSNGLLEDIGGGMIGVWKYGDSGDIEPWAVLHCSPFTKMRKPASLAINPDAKELIVPSIGRILFYHLPEIFQ